MGRCFQRLQIPIDPVLGSFVPLCSQFPFQLCPRVTPLMPALQEVGLVGIDETCSWLFAARVGDGSRRDPPLSSCVGSSPSSWPSRCSSSLVFAEPRCVHTEPFARLDGPVAPAQWLAFGQDAVLRHDAVG